MSKFSSRAAAPVGNGVCECGSEMSDHSAYDNHSPVEMMREWKPRLPVNPIVEHAHTERAFGDDHFVGWCESMIEGIDDPNDRIRLWQSAAHIKHARRVISLLLSIRRVP